MNPHNLTDQEASFYAHLSPEDETVLVVPLRGKFPEGFLFDSIDDDGDTAILRRTTSEKIARASDVDFITIPHPVGSIVGLRETWGHPTSEWNEVNGKWVETPHYVYKADYTPEEQKKYRCLFSSPVTMPSAAIRHHREIISSRVCQVGDVDEGEWVMTGIVPDDVNNDSPKVWEWGWVEVEQWFNRRYRRRGLTYPKAWVAVEITKGVRV